MPELPEVETIRLQLSKLLPGLRIEKILVSAKKSFKGNEKLLAGVKITGLNRAGKMIIIETDKDYSLAIHLKMTGQLIYKKNNEQGEWPGKYTRVIVSFADGSKLFFNDMRRFGWMKTVRNSDDLTNNLGPDPLQITVSDFCKILQSSKKPVKLLLTDQEKLAGVGNIYANEALFMSGILPKRNANKINKKDSEELLINLKKALKKGIKFGGASDNNYLNALGEKGEMQEHFLVYGREGEMCLNDCSNNIKRIKQGARSSFYCPSCQK